MTTNVYVQEKVKTNFGAIHLGFYWGLHQKIYTFDPLTP